MSGALRSRVTNVIVQKNKTPTTHFANGGECAARVTVRSAAARSIKSYKGGDAVLSGNKRGE